MIVHRVTCGTRIDFGRGGNDGEVLSYRLADSKTSGDSIDDDKSSSMTKINDVQNIRLPGFFAFKLLAIDIM